MPHHQKEIVLSNFRKSILSMIARVLNKRARLELMRYLIANKISINQSSVILTAVRDVILSSVLALVSIVLFIASLIWGNAWVAIPFFTFLIGIPLYSLTSLLLIPRSSEAIYFKKGEIKPEYAREFKKRFPESYSKLSPSMQEIIDGHITSEESKKKIPLIILVYRNWTIILLAIFLLLMILSMNDWIPF